MASPDDGYVTRWIGDLKAGLSNRLGAGAPALRGTEIGSILGPRTP